MFTSPRPGRVNSSWLLAHAESQAPKATTAFAMATGARSSRNIDLYKRAGYRITAPSGQTDTLHLSKARTQPTSAPTLQKPGQDAAMECPA